MRTGSTLEGLGKQQRWHVSSETWLCNTDQCCSRTFWLNTAVRQYAMLMKPSHLCRTPCLHLPMALPYRTSSSIVCIAFQQLVGHMLARTLSSKEQATTCTSTVRLHRFVSRSIVSPEEVLLVTHIACGRGARTVKVEVLVSRVSEAKLDYKVHIVPGTLLINCTNEHAC